MDSFERARNWFDFFFFQAEDGIRDYRVTGVQTCALPIYDATHHPDPRLLRHARSPSRGGGPVPDAGWTIWLPATARLPAIPDAGGTVWLPRTGKGRGGEEGRTRGAPDHLKKKKQKKAEPP